MGFKYLGKNDEGELKTWKQYTRDERFFCAELYFELKSDLKPFLKLLDKKSVNLLEKDADKWEVGYEVCFYRDYLFNNKEDIPVVWKESEYSQKRTFDLCLFSEKQIIVIEAKAQKGFDGKQLLDFEKDKRYIKKLLKRHDLSVEVVALASSIYLDNENNILHRKIPLDKKDGIIVSTEMNKYKEIFAAQLNWLEVRDTYPKNMLFERADQVYGLK